MTSSKHSSTKSSPTTPPCTPNTFSPLAETQFKGGLFRDPHLAAVTELKSSQAQGVIERHLRSVEKMKTHDASGLLSGVAEVAVRFDAPQHLRDLALKVLAQNGPVLPEEIVTALRKATDSELNGGILTRMNTLIIEHEDAR